MRPWWPSALNNLWFPAYQASINNGTSFQHQTKALPESPRARLITIMDTINPETLSSEDARIFRWIEKDKPWVLTEKELQLLQKLKSQSELLQVLLHRTTQTEI